jgi:hypothetical protein
VVRALWPQKTAPSFAAAAHCSLRAVEYRLAGEREPTCRMIRAVIVKMLD